jgi:hypothetical protein
VGGIRIRWGALGRFAAIAAAGLAALQILPGLLQAPQPPPLARDVGLPRVRRIRPAKAMPRPKHAARFQKHEIHVKGTIRSVGVEKRPTPGPAATAVIGSVPHGRKPMRRQPKPAAGAKPAEPIESPPVSPAPAPAAPIEAPPPAPAAPLQPVGDGSIEFEPH